MREVLEAWFSHYPEECRYALRSRFRHQEGDDHLPAFLELFIHEILLRLGCAVEVLDVGGGGEGRRPDFLVTSRDCGPFYLEATVVTEESKEDRAEKAITQQMYDQLNRLIASPDFFVSIEVHGASASSPPTSRIAADLSAWLAQMDPDEISRHYESRGWESLPTWRYAHEGSLIVVSPIPKARKARGEPGLRPLGMLGPGEATLVESARYIKEKVEKKARAYGRLDLPFVLAVNALGKYADHDDVREALFATSDGKSTGAFSPIRQRVSAVVATVRMRPSHVTRSGLQLYRNPWARIPYQGCLDRLPRVELGDAGPKECDGESVASILGLPPEWPGEAQGGGG